MIVRGIPVGRRSLFVERRRAALGVVGVAVTLLMVLLLDGVFAGAMRQVTRYIDTSPADVFVAQAGVRNMHMASSAVPLDVLAPLRAQPGVTWAEPILYEPATLVAGDRTQLAYLIGYQSGGRGGPVTLTAGGEPGPGEIVLDREAATSLEIAVGDQVTAFGRSWRVSGVVTGMGNIVNALAYVNFDDVAAARQTPGYANFLLVGGDLSPGDLADRVEEVTGLSAEPRTAFSAEERRVVADMAVDIMQIMTLAALLIGLAVVGLTLYAVTLARLREIGVMKALGAGPTRLGRDVAGQAGWTVGLALLVAVPLATAVGWGVEEVTGTVAVTVEVPAVLRAAAGVALVGAAGAVAPLIKVLRVDPASVFRRA